MKKILIDEDTDKGIFEIGYEQGKSSAIKKVLDDMNKLEEVEGCYEDMWELLKAKLQEKTA